MAARFTPLSEEDYSFVGHYFGHDVYIQATPAGTRVVANNGQRIKDDYASELLEHMKNEDPTLIGGRDSNGELWHMPYAEWLFSVRCPNYRKAMAVGLIVRTLPLYTVPTILGEDK